MFQEGNLVINRTTILRNMVALTGTSTAGSDCRGGGVYQKLGFLRASRLRVTRNQATSVRAAAGAGIYAEPSGGVKLSSLAVISNNITSYAEARGGGLYVGALSGRVLLTKLVVRNNTATVLGTVSDIKGVNVR